MNDLISRAALINYIKAWDIGNGIVHDQNTFIGAVNSQEVVDAVPVVHGKWIAQDATYTRFMCSACNSKNYSGHQNFCPNCGADMRKGGENNV